MNGGSIMGTGKIRIFLLKTNLWICSEVPTIQWLNNFQGSNISWISLCIPPCHTCQRLVVFVDAFRGKATSLSLPQSYSLHGSDLGQRETSARMPRCSLCFPSPALPIHWNSFVRHIGGSISIPKRKVLAAYLPNRMGDMIFLYIKRPSERNPLLPSFRPSAQCHVNLCRCQKELRAPTTATPRNMPPAKTLQGPPGIFLE